MWAYISIRKARSEGKITLILRLEESKIVAIVKTFCWETDNFFLRTAALWNRVE